MAVVINLKYPCQRQCLKNLESIVFIVIPQVKVINKTTKNQTAL